MKIDIKKNADKAAHFFYGYWINLFVVALATWLINPWVGVGVCLVAYIIREIKQKKDGGTNKWSEQVADVLFSIITAPFFAYVFPFIIDRVW